MFYASLRPLDHLFRSPYQFYSDDLSFWAYREMWNTVPMLGRYIFNSFFLASSVAILTLLFVIPAAYSYARFNFPFKNSSLYILLAINMFSGAVLLIPLYKLLRTFGLLNTYQAMIVPGVAFLIPTSIWLLKSYFEKIPIELEEAAFCDGASRSNPGDASIGVSILFDGKEVHAISKKIGIATNNEAEYQALIDGLNYCIDNSIKEIKVFLDSNLVVEQVNENFKVKAANLKVLNSKVKELIEEFKLIKINHVYREDNKRADQLANMALDK